MFIKDAHLPHSNNPFGRDLELKAGEITLLSGDSGSGKSTLMRCIAGFKELKSGEIDLEGKRVAMLLQNPFHQIIMQKAYDELLFPMKNAGMPDDEALVELKKVSAMLKIEHLLDRHMNTLSFGETQLLMIAATCLSPADIYLFDEPTSHLDPPYIKLYYDLLKYLAGQNKIVLTSTQCLDEHVFTDRTIILSFGSIKALYSKSEMEEKIVKNEIKTDKKMILDILEELKKK